jgi:peptidylprolyl isomerase
VISWFLKVLLFEMQLLYRYAPAIARDLEEVRRCAAPLDAAGLRGRGDARYRAGDVAGAMEAYGAVLELGSCASKDKAAALANRAACHLSRSDHGAAHDDCEEGLDALFAALNRGGADVGGGGGDGGWCAGNACEAAAAVSGGGDAVDGDGGGWDEVGRCKLNLVVTHSLKATGFIQPLSLSSEKLVSKFAFSNGSTCTGYDEQCTAVLAKLLHRRGAAAAHLRRYAAAAADYTAAARLLPAEAAAALEKDADTVRGLAEEEGSEAVAKEENNSYDEKWSRAEAARNPPPPAAAAPPAAADDVMRPNAGYETTFSVKKGAKNAAAAAVVCKGDTVVVHAVGHVEQSGKKFWSTRDKGESPFTYQAGVGGVITGWDVGALGMRVGETRKLRIPAEEGYGAAGFPAWGISPGACLLFELEVLSIQGK